MAGLPMKERLLHHDAFVPCFPKPYERTMTCTLKAVKGSKAVLHGGCPGSNWVPREEAFAVWYDRTGAICCPVSLSSL